MTERAEHTALDPLEMLLDAARYAEGNGGKYRNLEWAKAARAAVAKARLATQDQKPCGWQWNAVGTWHTVDFRECEDPEKYARSFGYPVRAIYAAPPPAAASPDHGGADAGVGATLPQGYALVPIKPTPEMIEAGCEHNPTQWNEGTDLGFAADVANDVYVAMVRSALSKPVAANASAEARDFCTYGPPDERKRQWIIVFEDTDRGMMIFSDEREAHTAWDKAKDNWTCTLFETSERKYHWAAGELRPLNASAEARLYTVQEVTEALYRALETLGFKREALSAHPHASDCDKQGGR